MPPQTPTDGFITSPKDMRTGQYDLTLRAEDVSAVGTSLTNAAWVPANAFGSIPESARAADAHRMCARAVASTTHGTAGELHALAAQMLKATQEYEMNEALAAERLRRR